MIQRVVMLLAVLALAGCGGVDPDSPLGKRKALFKQMLSVSEDMGGMLRGRLKYDEQQLVEQAVLLDEISRQPWQYFESEPDAGKSAARDELWQEKERFNRLARELEQATARLVETAGKQPLNPDTVAIRVEQVEQSCKNCHDAFRVY